MEFLRLIWDIKIIDIVDIIIVAAMVFRLILFVSNTRTFQILMGFFFVFIPLIIAPWYRLHTLTWLLATVLPIIAVAFVVIFQPELRKALEGIGRGTIFHRSINESVETKRNVCKEICKAAIDMSRNRIGALILLEKNISLSEYIESGTLMNCEINSMILENIFTPSTPLHDGAVIIRNARIAAANAYLPLTSNKLKRSEARWGARHRAALGISEVSDGICVIVSEETGNVAMAFNGRITKNLNESSLERLLITRYAEKD